MKRSLMYYVRSRIKSLIVKKTGIFLNVIYALCFIAIILSLLSVILVFYRETHSDIFIRFVVYLEIVVVVLHKVYTFITETHILGNTLNTQLRKNSFIKHNHIYLSITNEINHLFIVICLLLGITFVFLSLITGYLIKLIAVYVLTVLVLFRIRLALYYKSIGKILDYYPKHDNYNFVRGFAKLFLLEYNTTSFKIKHDIYKNSDYTEFHKDDQKQDECIKSILFFEVKYQIKHERTKWILVLLFLISNAFIIFYPKTDLYIIETLRRYEYEYLDPYLIKRIVVFVLNTLMCLVSATTLLRYKYTCNYAKKILRNLKSENSRERFNAYNRIDRMKNDYNKIRGLGLLTICVDQGYDIDQYNDKELLYRPLFRHYLRIPIKEFFGYLIMIIITELMLFVNSLNTISIIILIGSTVLLLLAMNYLIIPLTKRFIIKIYCERIKQKKG